MNRNAIAVALVIACVGGPLSSLCSEAVRGRLSDLMGWAFVGAASVFLLSAAYWLFRDSAVTHVRGK